MASDAWYVLVAAPGGRILRDACSLEVRPQLVRAIERHASRDGAWRETLEGGFVAHGLGRLGHVGVIAAPADVAAPEVEAYLDALLSSYGARVRAPAGVPPSTPSSPSGAPALIAAYTPPRRAS